MAVNFFIIYVISMHMLLFTIQVCLQGHIQRFFGTLLFKMVIFPYQHRGCLLVTKLQVSKPQSSKKLFFGVKYVRLVPYNTE